MADSFESIQNDIEVVRTETSKEKNTQFRVGGVMKKIFEFLHDLLNHKANTFYSDADPAITNQVRDGDKWIVPELKEYTRIEGFWLNLSGTGGRSTQPTIFTADGINFNDDYRTVINFNGDKNLIIKSK